jgi:SAM-dependent methyltransferase
MADPPFEYLLGDSDRETGRLAEQAALWDPVSHALFNRIGVRPGWKVLEIGPGAGSLHAELRRRVQGPVDFVEQSDAYCAALAERATLDGFGESRIWSQMLAEADLPANHYDLIFARWVFLFLPDPAGHVRQLARALKPGGLLALQDYLRESLCLVPKPADWGAFIAADRAFFASRGGDVNIGTRLPQLYSDAGLQMVDVTPTTKSGHPGSAVWNWLTAYFLGVLEPYAAFAPFSPAAADRIGRAWREAAQHPTSLLIAPTVLDVVGRK